MSSKLPISFCTFVKNEEESIKDCLESIKPIASEIVIVDTGSTDKTIEICKKYTHRIYKVGFSDFGSIRTLAAHLAIYPWVLMLDADERLLSEDYPKLAELIDQPKGVQGDLLELDEEGNVAIDSWALPRKRWADQWMRKQEDVESYPDWQVRLFRNHAFKTISFVRRVHETVSGCHRTEQSPTGPTIHHFQNVNKDKSKLKAREELYTKFRKLDTDEGIKHKTKAIIDLDKVDGNS